MTSPVGHGLLWGAAFVLLALAVFVVATWTAPAAVLLAGGFTLALGMVGAMVVHA